MDNNTLSLSRAFHPWISKPLTTLINSHNTQCRRLVVISPTLLVGKLREAGRLARGHTISWQPPRVRTHGPSHWERQWARRLMGARASLLVGGPRATAGVGVGVGRSLGY